MIYGAKYNDEEIRELLNVIEKANRTNNTPKHIKNNEKDFSNNDGLRADDSSAGTERHDWRVKVHGDLSLWV